MTTHLSKEAILHNNEITERSLYFERARSAMDEYAKQECIGFAEWIINSDYDFNKEGGYWYDMVMILYPQPEITTEQLYELYTQLQIK